VQQGLTAFAVFPVAFFEVMMVTATFPGRCNPVFARMGGHQMAAAPDVGAVDILIVAGGPDLAGRHDGYGFNLRGRGSTDVEFDVETGESRYGNAGGNEEGGLEQHTLGQSGGLAFESHISSPCVGYCLRFLMEAKVLAIFLLLRLDTRRRIKNLKMRNYIANRR
jgi:hypothetical protein